MAEPKKRHKPFTRRHDKCVSDFCSFMNEEVKHEWKPIKKTHYGHSCADVDAGDDWSDLSVDIKTTSGGFRHHSLLQTIKAKYGKNPVLVSRKTHERTGAVAISWELFRSLICAAVQKEV